MNIIDIRDNRVKLDSGLPPETVKYLETIIPKDISKGSSDLVRAVNELIWEKGIPIYLVDRKQMPNEYSVDDNSEFPPTEYLGYYKYVNLGKVEMESIFLCIDRIGNDNQKLAKVLIHEIGHAIMEAKVGDYGYDINKNDIIKFMEESLANYIVLKYLKELGTHDDLLGYSRTFIEYQGFGYNFGVKWYEWDNRNYYSWTQLKKEVIGDGKSLTFENIVLYKSIVCYCNCSTLCVGNHNDFYNELQSIFPDKIKKLNAEWKDEGYWDRKDKAAMHCCIIDL